MSKVSLTDEKLLIGRDEWCSLPSLSIPLIKAKIDTGAKTSALHAFNIKTCKKRNQPHVIFDVHPIQANNDISLTCCMPIYDVREVMSSNGHKESRYVIVTPLDLGGRRWEIELTLSNRDPLRYRMLLGCQALSSHVLIDPHLSCHLARHSKKNVLSYY